MELWQIEQYCETSSLDTLRRIEVRLSQLIETRQLTGTNANLALQRVREAILLRELFEAH